MGSSSGPSKGDEFHYADGIVEIVIALESNRVLTLREYERVDVFSECVADATYQGINEDILNLPPAEAFSDHSDESTDSGRNSESSDSKKDNPD